MSTVAIATEPTAPIETKVLQPSTKEEEVSIAIVEDTPSTDPAVIAGELLSEPTQEPPKTTEEEGLVNATEVPAPAKTTTLTKRRTIFNPFGKNATKKEESEEKKTSKGFGTFFSRSKAKIEETDSTTVENEVVSTELPHIEQLQPIETDIQVAEGGEHTTVKETLQDAVETVEAEVSEVVQEVEQAAAQVANAVKRQSFISKFFGTGSKKKQDSVTTKEEHQETHVETRTEEITTTEEEETTAITTTTTTTAAAAAAVRPSSPLGKLTELFTKKTTKKTKVTSEEAAPAEETHDVEAIVNDTHVAEVTPAVVTASA